MKAPARTRDKPGEHSVRSPSSLPSIPSTQARENSNRSRTPDSTSRQPSQRRGLAVTANLTVVGQTTAGYVSVTPSPTASPATSTLNMPSGDVRANGITVRVAGGDDIALVYKASSGARTHLLLDISGYFD